MIELTDGTPNLKRITTAITDDAAALDQANKDIFGDEMITEDDNPSCHCSVIAVLCRIAAMLTSLHATERDSLRKFNARAQKPMAAAPSLRLDIAQGRVVEAMRRILACYMEARDTLMAMGIPPPMFDEVLAVIALHTRTLTNAQLRSEAARIRRKLQRDAQRLIDAELAFEFDDAFDAACRHDRKNHIRLAGYVLRLTLPDLFVTVPSPEPVA